MYVGGRWGTLRAAAGSQPEPEDGMRTRSTVIGSLEGVYLIDIRDLLLELRSAGDPEEPSLLDKARAIREFTKLGAR